MLSVAILCAPATPPGHAVAAGVSRSPVPHLPTSGAGDIEVTVVGEALLTHLCVAAARPGGVAYLVVCRHAVDHRAAQRVRYHRQVIRMVIQPLTLQVFVPGLRFSLVARTLYLKYVLYLKHLE